MRDPHRPYLRLGVILLLTLLVAGLLAGCSASKLEAGQPAHTGDLLLAPENALGQTFTARFDGLEGLVVLLKPLDETALPTQGKVVLQLHASPDDPAVLRSAELPLAAIVKPDAYRFDFPPMPDSNGRDYYALLRLPGEGQIEVGTAGPETYTRGGLYQAGLAIPLQMTFGVRYDAVTLAGGLLREGLGWLGLLLAGAFLFVPPGWALLNGLLPGWERLAWIERLGLSIGLSLAVYPVLILWTHLIGLNLGPVYAWGPPLAGLGWLGWRNRATLRRRPTIHWPGVGALAAHASDLLLLFVIGLGFAVRLWVVRGLDFPMWGDSYQHTLMAQLLVDHKGLFDSWQPYAELTTFTYHFGFHTMAALFHWVTGMEMRQSVLWSGQILNELAVITLIPLALRLHRSRWTALAVALCGGLFFLTPMAYTNWGRYTQLAGQTILPVVIYLVWDELERPAASLRPLILGWIALGGLALTHYRVLAFGLTFYIVMLLVGLARRPLLAQVKRILGSGIGGGLIFLPWFIHVFAGQLIGQLASYLGRPPAAAGPAEAETLLAAGANYLAPLAWFLIVLALGWSLWRHERRVLVVLGWWFCNLLVTNPHWLQLSGAGAINNFTLAIASYIPACLLLGPAAGWLVDSLRQVGARRARRPAWLFRAAQVGLAVGVIGLSLWSARQRMFDIHPDQYSLATRADQRAARWIDANLPAESVFLVNSFFAYNNTSVVGADGGWWLPLIAGRRTTLPPLTYASEQGPRPDYHAWVNELSAAIDSQGVDSALVQTMLVERGVTHVYLGQQQGSVNNPAGGIHPELLYASRSFHLVYRQDQVYIFAFTP